MAEAQDQKGKKTTTIDREKMDLATAEAKRFMEDYYRTFDANRADLVNLYRDDSAMDFDYQKIQGKEAILAKLTSLQRFRFQIDKIDCLPDALEGSGALVMVTGFIWLDGRQDAFPFGETFLLVPTLRGSFHILLQIWTTYYWRLEPKFKQLLKSPGPVPDELLLQDQDQDRYLGVNKPEDASGPSQTNRFL
ncbi:hypothetical protein BT93_K1332 [Corymbia citriodora subsp. variegata]|nr:hypothetical protein BT93_K1213 [Corymbia citriodora subsp. variegata]KAF8007300.1 hypothetical protein BT93_K1332 [Corymbia citriodora subsp. variegata]